MALVRLVAAADRVVETHVILGEDGEFVAALHEVGATVEIPPMDERFRDLAHTCSPGSLDAAHP